MDKHKYKPGDIVTHAISGEKLIILANITPKPTRDDGIDSPWYLTRGGLDQDDPDKDYQRKRFCELELKPFKQ